MTIFSKHTINMGGLLDINIWNIGYIAFRLSPFIIVCFFTLESFLNWNLKGIVYLFGLLVACVINIVAASIFPEGMVAAAVGPAAVGGAAAPAAAQNTNVCNTFTLGMGGPLTSLPLSTAVFSYTFFYLLTFIVNLASKNGKGFVETNKGSITNQGLSNAMTANVPTLILFPFLIIVDGLWNWMYGCANPVNICASIIVGSLVGLIWASIITVANNPDLQYISSTNGQVCSKPTNTLFKCKIKN